jgi:kynurenine formamidase
MKSYVGCQLLTMMKGPGMTDGYEIVEHLLPLVSNWGRWGADDDLGTLNYLTDQHARAALRLPAAGRAVPCGRPLRPGPAAPGDGPLLHHMLATGAESPERGAHVQADWFGVQPHGTSITHLDALNHVSWHGQLYNGRSASVVTATRGGAFGSGERVSRGVVTRGVLLDIPESLGVGWVDPESPITARQLSASARECGADVRSGDVVIIRTGRDRRRAAGAAGAAEDELAGLDVDCLPWLHEREVALLGSEGLHEVVPARYPGLATPVHVLALVGMGLWLLDNLAVDELAAACQEAGRWEFLFVLSPIALKNSTGIPVNPLAVL